MGYFDDERNCLLALTCSVALILVCLSGVLTSVNTGYYVDEIIDGDDERPPINTSNQSEDASVYYYNYSELNSDQQEEFMLMMEQEYISNMSALQSLDEMPINIQYQGEKYIIQEGFLFSFEDKLLGWSSVVGIIIGIVGVVYSYEKRIQIRLKKIREKPLEVIDIGDEE